jgi:transcriptional regulator with XRE-family HTH domain
MDGKRERKVDPDRKLFAEELRAMRKQRGLSVHDLGALVNYSGGTITMIETMWRSPTHQLAVKLDEVFGLPGTFQRLEARIRGVPFTRGFRPFKEAEAEATSLRMFEHTLMPGLFQTEAYARVLLEVLPEVTEDVVKERLSARMERQQILAGDTAPRVIALLDEQSLDRNVGGPAVMADQIDRLAELARLPKTIIQVIPADCPHQGLAGAFVIAETAEWPAIVYLDSVLDGTVFQETDTAEDMIALFDTLRAEAFTGSASLRLIEEKARWWREQITA